MEELGGVYRMLEIKSIEKHFGTFKAVNGLSIQVKPGQAFGLIGANGAGKTTTFRMILGLLEPTSGSVTWNGEYLNYKNTELFGYLPEERGLYPKMKVKEQLIYLGKLKGMKKKEIIQEIDYWFTKFGITSFVNKKAGELSKGNQQKVQFIVAVLHKPEVLILDEPFSGLDPVNVELLKSAIEELKQKGTAIIFSSHRMDHIEEICEDICMIKRGAPVAFGKIDDIKKEFPTHALLIKCEDQQDRYPIIELLKQKPEVKEVQLHKQDQLKVQLHDEKDAKMIFELLSQFSMRSIIKEELTLNEIFIQRVGESVD